MQRPLLATAALKQLSPRKLQGTRYYSNPPPLRVQQVRDESPYRQRTNSFKRKQDDVSTYAAITSNGNNKAITIDNGMAEELAIEVSKVNSLCDKVGTTLSKLEIDSTILSVFYDLKNAVSGICGIQEKILLAGNKVNPPATAPDSESNGMTDLGNIAKRPRQLDLNIQLTSQPTPSVQVHTVRQPDPPTEEERIQKKFKEAVRIAENSTLVLNLDMGKVPIINKETIKKNATMALVIMAAKMEENNHTSVPCEDTIVALDDILSVVKGMEFYGKKTKTYNNPKDKLSGSYCTIPV
jgi:hypothetical protein